MFGSMIPFFIKLNSFLLLMQFINGKSDNPEKVCLDCLENALETKRAFPYCEPNFDCDHEIDTYNLTENFPRPFLVCRDEVSLTFAWKPQETSYYFFQYTIVNLNEIKMSELTSWNNLTINGLIPNQTYEIVLLAYSFSNNKVYKSAKTTHKTLKSTDKRTSVNNLNYTLNLSEDLYEATVKWAPGSDLSCFYEIVWYGKHEEGEYVHRRINLKKQLKPEFNLTNLEFGKQYRFSVTSIDRYTGSESPKKSLKILIPTCVETFRNLSICVPAKPKNLTVSIENGTNLKLNWNNPDLKPDFYDLHLMSFNTFRNESFELQANTSGASCSALLENLQLKDYYVIKLTAHSKAGHSEPAYFRQSFNNNTQIVLTKTNYLENIFKPAAVVVIIALVLVAVYFLRSQIKKAIFGSFFAKKTAETVVTYTATEMEDSKWELVESKLFVDNVIGFGAFGIVQKGYYGLEPDNKIEVAIKTLKAKPTPEQITQFYDEIEIMKSVPCHAHIVYLIGVVTKDRPSNPLMLVEYCSKGDLQTYLRKVAFVLGERCAKSSGYVNEIEREIKNSPKFFNKCYDLDKSKIPETKYILECKDLLSFARQIAVGMEFLSNLKVIHRDLAARNVLISKDNTLKISDFGLSRDIYVDNVYRKVTGGKLPFRWMAIESLTHQIYTTESDVWSFGIVLWEIATLGGNPYPAVNTENLVGLLKSGYRMEKPANCKQELYNVMLSCWQTSSNLRPSFKCLKETFDKLLESEMQYINLDDIKKLDSNQYENTVSNKTS